MYKAIIHSPVRRIHVNGLNKTGFDQFNQYRPLLLKAVLRIRIRSKFVISWVNGPESESRSQFREENEETSFSQFLKSLYFFRRTVGFSWSLCSSKTLILIQLRDPDSTKKPGSESGFSDTGLSTLVGNIRSVPLFLVIFLKENLVLSCILL
jgi:hypothetical protein